MEIGAENIVAVLSTTSCFAPRASDKIEELVNSTPYLFITYDKGLNANQNSNDYS